MFSLSDRIHFLSDKMSTAVAPHPPSQSVGSPRQHDRKALVSSDGKNGNFFNN